MDEKNKLYFGDNLKILRDYVDEASVDLIYLDPPFNSSATYNFSVAPLYERRLFSEKAAKSPPPRSRPFEDAWQWGLESEAAGITERCLDTRRGRAID